MNKHLTATLKYLLSGILLFAATATRAQDTGNGHGNSSDTTRHHRYGMHSWGNNDNHTQPFRRGPEGFNKDGWSHRGFGHSPHFNRPRIHCTPDQRRQMMAIDREYRQKREDLFKQDNLTLKQYKAGLLSLEKEKKGRLAALLTPEQKNQLTAGRKRMDENRQVREAARLERLRLHLNLTEDQVARIKAGNENLRNQAKAIHEDDNLLPQQKMEQMKALMAKRNDTYKSVLTPDQYTQFEKMMSHRRAVGGPLRGSRAI